MASLMAVVDREGFEAVEQYAETLQRLAAHRRADTRRAALWLMGLARSSQGEWIRRDALKALGNMDVEEENILNGVETLLRDDTADRLIALLRRLRLPTHVAGAVADDLLPIIRRDKKVIDQEVRMVLPVRLGEVTVMSVSDDALSGALDAWLREG